MQVPKYELGPKCPLPPSSLLNRTQLHFFLKTDLRNGHHTIDGNQCLDVPWTMIESSSTQRLSKFFCARCLILPVALCLEQHPTGCEGHDKIIGGAPSKCCRDWREHIKGCPGIYWRENVVILKSKGQESAFLGEHWGEF